MAQQLLWLHLGITHLAAAHDVVVRCVLGCLREDPADLAEPQHISNEVTLHSMTQHSTPVMQHVSNQSLAAEVHKGLKNGGPAFWLQESPSSISQTQQAAPQVA